MWIESRIMENNAQNHKIIIADYEKIIWVTNVELREICDEMKYVFFSSMKCVWKKA